MSPIVCIHPCSMLIEYPKKATREKTTQHGKSLITPSTRTPRVFYVCLTAGQRHYAHLSPFYFPVLLAADLLLQGCQLTQYTEGYTLTLLEFARKVGTPSVRGLGTWIATKCAPRTSKSMQQGRTIQQPRRPNPSPKRLPSSRRAEPASVETTVVLRTSRFCSSLLLPYFREANRSPF